MGTKTKIVLTAVITAVLSAAVSCRITSFVKDIIPSDNMNKIDLVESFLDSKYLYDYDKTKAEEAAIKAYVASLEEPYTEYYTKEEFSSYMENVEDGYVGIGVIVGVNDENKIEVVAPFENSPAYKVGILPGDILMAVEGVEYGGDNLTEAVNNIKNGKEGTFVNITILRNNTEKIDLMVERCDISAESVNSEMLDSEVGYIRITSFNMESENGEHSTFTEFRDAVNELKNSGMCKMIIDLRDNPGGLLNSACDIADMLLPEGVITYTEDKAGERSYINSNAERLGIPVVILINGNSASASEVLTGAMKDYGTATVVGTKSYGKGIVQNVYPFFDGSGISLTSSKYYTPNGVCIHEIGIEPDIVVEMPENFKDMYTFEIEKNDDVQLQKAIEIIKEK